MTDAQATSTTEGADVADRNPADGRVIAREDAAFARAAEANTHIKDGLHFADWLAIGEGLAALRDRALRESYSNRPYGKAYTQTYAKLKLAHPWASEYDTATISHACWLADNVTDVMRWREALASNQREAWVSPRVIHQHYDRMTKPKEEKASTASSESRGNKDQTIIRLQEEVDMLRKKGAGSGLMPGASVDELVEEIALAHNPRFMRRAADALIKRADIEERQDAIEKGVKGKARAKAKPAATPRPPHVELDAVTARPTQSADENRTRALRETARRAEAQAKVRASRSGLVGTED
jgi:hypothetical protein